jgi:hypothetical protein
MAHSNLILILDRLSVSSAMRGSTSTVCGVLGAIMVLVLCMVFYIPAAIDFFNGNFFESELFYRQG